MEKVSPSPCPLPLRERAIKGDYIAKADYARSLW